MRKNQWKTAASIATLSLCLGLSVLAAPATVKAATESWSWETVKSDKTYVSLTPGADETELNFAWYSQGTQDAKVKFSTNADMSGAKEFTGNTTNINSVETGYYSNKVTVTGLKENTKYYYQVCKSGEWQAPEEYQTRSFSNYSFLYVGDPQIGASGSNENDSSSWNNVLNGAIKSHPDVSFIVSAGDQVNSGDNEEQYSGYLGADVLRSLPVATTIGNHEKNAVEYTYHYNNPNNFEKASASYTGGRTSAGTDYYYTYGDVLFIVLDTNNYNCATHENVIKRAIKENPNAKWRVLTFHQDIYGAAKSHSDSDGMVLRTQLTPIIDEYDIDVVLQGHDHTYSRTYQLTSDGKQHQEYDEGNYTEDNKTYQKENECYELKSDMVGGTITNPEGTVYYEANSATGSKYYDLFQPVQDYIAEKSQTYTPTYSVVNVTDDTFSVTTYDATTQKPVQGSSTYTIVKKEQNQEQTTTQKPDTNTTAENNTQAQTQTPTQTQNQTSAAATVAKPNKVTAVKAVKAQAGKVRINWKRDKQVTGYQVVYSYKKNFNKNVKKVNISKNKKNSVVLKNLKKGKTLYVKVRSYKKVNGKKVFGSYSTVRKVTVR